MKRILIIDGSSLFFRAFYALPLLKTKKGQYTNAIYGFISMLENAINKIKPNSVVVCFDMKGKTFRSDIYKEYKGTRQKTPTELEQQFPVVREILDFMNIKYLESPIYEADDIAGTIANLAERENYESFLLTGDRDYYQLVTKNTSMLYTVKGITDLKILTEDSIFEEYKIYPKQFIDVKALMGDVSDNIPGVKGIGEKTALKLIREYENIENLYNNLDSISGKKLKSNLEDEKTQAFISKKLGTIITDINLDINISDFKLVDYDYENLSNLYREYEFNSLLQRLPEKYHIKSSEKTSDDILKFRTLDLDSLLKEIEEDGEFSFKFITDGKIYEGINPIYIAIKLRGKFPVIFKINDNKDILKFKGVFESDKIIKYGYDLKEDIIILMYFDIKVANFKFDSKIAEYIIDSTRSDYDINNLSIKYFGSGYLSDEELLGKNKSRITYSKLDEEKLFKYFAFYVNIIDKLRIEQLKKITELEMQDLYNDVELPLVETLSSMELTGIRTEEKVLDQIGKDLDVKIDELEEKIYVEAGEKFNIKSTKQLGEILFEKMKLPTIKKTKTGYSTSIEVLEKLIGYGKIIGYIIDYRKFTKLKSTYVDGLKTLINKNTGRIHSHFNQTIASTGRISSTNPNLQNIPIKNEDGRLIRKAFLASEGCKLLDLDYSQIELRVLGSLSNDKNMIKAFKNNLDIHRSTASEVFNVDLKDVTPLLRSRAKAVNFGIVYGISDYGLSVNLNIPRATAKEYIDKYLDNYSGVRQFMHKAVEEAKKFGYAKTILNRRRYIEELNAKNFNIRSFGERVAINTPIQGSAADIIKIAMVKVYQALKEKNLKSKLILQIHDELILDVVEEELQDVTKLVKDIMENAVKMSIDLKVDLEVGGSLYETK